ncbi:hypothetical protein [Paraprevotella xylaniphila]|uniref:hypothetical protein n=2 Tax=Paraprevotella xylaniphila TaxID=454155 RepID=UPI001559C35C|nr:hypothetical protein [Paraprevotella xylaniphila]
MAEKTLFFSARHSGNLCTPAEKRPENGTQTYASGAFFLYLGHFRRQKTNIKMTEKHRHTFTPQPFTRGKIRHPEDSVTSQSRISLTIRFHLLARESNISRRLRPSGRIQQSRPLTLTF